MMTVWMRCLSIYEHTFRSKSIRDQLETRIRVALHHHLALTLLCLARTWVMLTRLVMNSIIYQICMVRKKLRLKDLVAWFRSKVKRCKICKSWSEMKNHQRSNLVLSHHQFSQPMRPSLHEHFRSKTECQSHHKAHQKRRVQLLHQNLHESLLTDHQKVPNVSLFWSYLELVHSVKCF